MVNSQIFLSCLYGSKELTGGRTESLIFLSCLYGSKGCERVCIDK